MSDSITPALTSIFSSGQSAHAARAAANTQAAAADRATQAQLDMYNQTRSDQAPWRYAGGNALNALNSWYGLPTYSAPVDTTGTATQPMTQPGATTATTPTQPGLFRNNQYLQSGRIVPGSQDTQGSHVPTPNDPTVATSPTATTQAIQQTPDYSSIISNLPGYQFQMQQGQQAVERNLAARGLLQSGAAGKAITQYGQNYASNYVDNYLNGLRSMAGLGQTATQATSAAGQNTANNIGANMQNAGLAQASGYINQANSINNGLQGISKLWGSNSYTPSTYDAGYVNSWQSPSLDVNTASNSSSLWDGVYMGMT